MTRFNPASTALVLIDLQQGILALPTAPYTSAEVLEKGRSLAEQFRAAGAQVVLVNVGWHDDYGDTPPGLTGLEARRPEGGLPAGWMSLADGLQQPGDLLITKRQWGAFTGTELDLQLRRRGIDTIVVAGIATNMGVESTVRHGWELGYNVVVAEDATSGLDATLHKMAFDSVFPHIARVLSTADIGFEGA